MCWNTFKIDTSVMEPSFSKTGFILRYPMEPSCSKTRYIGLQFTKKEPTALAFK